MKRDILVTALCFLTSLGWTQDNRPQYLFDAFETIQDSLGFNGAISILQDDTIFFSGVAGFANREFQNEITPTTRFRIASLSKPIISYAIHILVDRGKLEFESSIANYLPEISRELVGKVLLKQLVEHTSGLIRDFKVIENGSNQEHYARHHITNLINQSKLQSDPGEKYAYSNTGYTLLAFIIENVTQLPLNDALNSLIFEPLEMNSTSHEKLNQVYDQFASGYDQIGDVIYKAAYEDKSHVFGSGSIFSTATDISKFASEVITGSLLSRKMHARYLEAGDENRTRGGWITWKYSSKLHDGPESGQILYFAGSCPGFRSFVGIYVAHRIAVIGLMNQIPINPSKLNNVFGNIMVGYTPEEIRRPILQELMIRISSEKLGDVQEFYEAWKKMNSNGLVREYELNQVGYVLLGHQKIELAVKVFTFLTMISPENSNAFDSLGEALIANGDLERGLKAYQKSLTLDPTNGNAKAMIELYSEY